MQNFISVFVYKLILRNVKHLVKKRLYANSECWGNTLNGKYSKITIV